MLTLTVTPESAPVLRLLIATMRDLRALPGIVDLSEIVGQARLTCAASGLDPAVHVLPILRAIRDRDPIVVTAREHSREPAHVHGPELPCNVMCPGHPATVKGRQ